MPTASARSIDIGAELRPLMRGGSYRLSVTQTVRMAGAARDLDSFTRTQRLQVNSVQHVLAPETVLAVFPLDGSSGQFHRVLPHAVLTDVTLPWQRACEVDPPQASRPWLAVLLLPAEKAPPLRWVNESVLADPQRPEQAKGWHAVPPPALPGEAREGDPLAAVIDLDAQTFRDAAPRYADLHLLCHVRRVPIADKAAVDQAPPPSQYAVVTCARPPRTMGRWTAWLVSLEGLADLLPDRTPKADGHIRLVCFKSWSFGVSSTERDSFLGILGEVDVAGFGKPSATAGGDADRWMAAGYWPLAHRFADNSLQLSWYRPPLVGSRRPGPPLPMRQTSAEAQLAFDAETGSFDATPATAWQLGRLLALRHADFAEALYRVKHQGFRERLVPGERRRQLSALLDADPAREAESAVPRRDAARLRTLIGAFARLRDAAAKPGTAPPLDIDEQLIARQLGKWMLLESIPLHYLLPDPALLPPESLRFFALDRRWVTALLDGALSLGEEPGSAFGSQIRTALARLAINGMEDVRAGFHDDSSLDTRRPGEAEPWPEITGFVLRSRAVGGWPGMDFEGRAAGAGADTPGARLDMLRCERFASEIVLCLFRGAVATVDLIEPGEGTHFAVKAGRNIGTGPGLDLSLLFDGAATGSMTAVEFAQAALRTGTRIRFAIDG